MVILVMITIFHPTQVYTSEYHDGHHIVPYLKTFGGPHQLSSPAVRHSCPLNLAPTYLSKTQSSERIVGSESK